MQKKISHKTDFVILSLAFIGGFVSLALEITVSRLLAPAFGTSLFVWTNVIGIVLAGLAIGAAIGGKLADKKPQIKLLATITAVTSIYILLLPTFSYPFLRVAANALTERSSSIFIASLIATMILVFFPMLALGTVTPFVIRLRAYAITKVGKDAGHVSAIATTGSIIGTFLPTLWLIPTFGVKITIITLGTILLLNSIIVLGWHWTPALFIPLIALLLPFSLIMSDETIATSETPYQYVAVDLSPDGTRTLRMNEGQGFHSIYNPTKIRPGTIYDNFDILPAMHEGKVEKAYVIGLAGGSISHAFNILYPEVEVIGVELDPGVIEIGKKYFTLNDPNLRIVNQDGRIALTISEEKVDIMVTDAYRQPYIPFHMATREYFELCKSRLNHGGIFSMNVATASRNDKILNSILNTVAYVYGDIYVYEVPGYMNFLVFASPDGDLLKTLKESHPPDQILDIKQNLIDGLELVTYDPNQIILTDDRAPVEMFTEQMLYNQATRSDLM